MKKVYMVFLCLTVLSCSLAGCTSSPNVSSVTDSLEQSSSFNQSEVDSDTIDATIGQVEKFTNADVSQISENKYTNSKYGFVVTMPDYWINKAVIVETDKYDNTQDSTKPLEYIIFYNKSLYNSGELSSAYLFMLEVYNVKDYDNVLSQNSSMNVLLKNDNYVVVAIKRTGAGIIDNKAFAEQWKQMDSEIDDIMNSLTSIK